MTEHWINIPPEAPVMVLPGTLLFPHSMLPLYIFEPRYRAMLAWALEHDRMFCVALMKPGVTDATSTDDFFHTAGIGVIRACVTHDDETSHLILLGLARVQFRGFTQLEPFRIAQLEPVESIPPSDDAAAGYSSSIRELCAGFEQQDLKLPEKVEDYLAQMSDPGVLADTVAHAFVRDPLRRQELLEESDVACRLRTLIRHLREEQK